MEKLEIKKTALALGLLFGLMHLIWVVVVGIFGETAMKLVANMHFLSISGVSFSIGTAILGVVLAFISGYITGAVFAWIYNKLGTE